MSMDDIVKEHVKGDRVVEAYQCCWGVRRFCLEKYRIGFLSFNVRDFDPASSFNQSNVFIKPFSHHAKKWDM